MIRRLDPPTKHYLKAQRVVQDFESVVEELLKNALDAKASKVRIKLDLQSLSVCVEDNGEGISEPDVRQLGIEDYSPQSSRVSPAGELHTFPPTHKGESLLAIAAASSNLLVISTQDSSTSSAIVGGEGCVGALSDVLLSFFKSAPPTGGTTVIASRVFQRWPVRLRHLRSQINVDKLLAQLRNVIYAVCLRLPQVDIVVCSLRDGDFVPGLSVSECERESEVFCQLFNYLKEHLIRVDSTESSRTIEGFYVAANIPRYTLQLVLCNREPVCLTSKQNESIRRILKRAGFPSKRLGLVSKTASRTVHFYLNFSVPPHEALSSPTDTFVLFWDDFVAQLTRCLTKESSISPKKKMNCKRIDFESEFDVELLTPEPQNISIEAADLQDGRIRVISQIDKLFLLTSINERLFLVDQHACEERILFESLLQDLIGQIVDQDSSLLLQCDASVCFDLSQDEATHMQQISASYAWYGVLYQICDSECVVSHLPRYLMSLKDPNSLKKCLLQFTMEGLKEPQTWPKDAAQSWPEYSKYLPRVLREAIIFSACRQSIKFGHTVTHHEAEYLIDSLSRCELPFQCAHGRPTIVPFGDTNTMSTWGKDYQL